MVNAVHASRLIKSVYRPRNRREMDKSWLHYKQASYLNVIAMSVALIPATWRSVEKVNAQVQNAPSFTKPDIHVRTRLLTKERTKTLKFYCVVKIGLLQMCAGRGFRYQSVNSSTDWGPSMCYAPKGDLKAASDAMQNFLGEEKPAPKLLSKATTASGTFLLPMVHNCVDLQRCFVLKLTVNHCCCLSRKLGFYLANCSSRSAKN